MAIEDPILIVDDEGSFVTPIMEYLETHGIGVIYAANGQTAFELFKRHNFPVIVSDILMPKMDGLDFLEKVKAINPLTRFILFSIVDDQETKNNAFRLHADEYIAKTNFTNEDLLTKISDQYQKYQLNESAKRRLRKESKGKIARGQTREVMDELMYCEFIESKKQNEIVILSAQLSGIEQNQRLGINYEESTLIRINSSIIKILDEI